MTALRIVKLVLTTVTILFSMSPISLADPIYLKPGQCLTFGGQQVCAMKPDEVDTPKSEKLYVCRYGQYKDAEVPELKSYAMFEIRTSPYGVKSETAVKNFGQNGKENCEKEADARTAAAK